MVDFSLELHVKNEFLTVISRLYGEKAYFSPYDTNNPTKFTLNSQEFFPKKG